MSIEQYYDLFDYKQHKYRMEQQPC